MFSIRVYQRTLFIQLIFETCVFHVTIFPPTAWLHLPAHEKKHNPIFLSIRPNEGLTFEPSALETIEGGQTTLSTHLIQPNYLGLPFHTEAQTYFNTCCLSSLDHAQGRQRTGRCHIIIHFCWHSSRNALSYVQ